MAGFLHTTAAPVSPSHELGLHWAKSGSHRLYIDC